MWKHESSQVQYPIRLRQGSGGQIGCWALDIEYLHICELRRIRRDADKEPTHYVHEFKRVKAGDTLKVKLAPGGGFVVRLV